MNKTFYAIVLGLLTNSLFAGDIGKAFGKLRDYGKDATQKAKAWGDHIESRNQEDIDQIEKEFDRIWGNIEKTVNQAWDDIEGEGKRVTDTLETDWKNYKARRKSEPAAPAVAELSAEDKIVAGSRVYTKLNIEAFTQTAKAGSFEGLVKTFETALHQESLNTKDASYVKNAKGETVLHSLVEQAYSLEKDFLRKKQAAQLQGDVAPSLEASVSYQQTILAISFFAESTQMGAVKSAAGNLPIDIVLAGTPMSIGLARHLVIHDLSNASKNRMKQLFPSK